MSQTILPHGNFLVLLDSLHLACSISLPGDEDLHLWLTRDGPVSAVLEPATPSSDSTAANTPVESPFASTTITRVASATELHFAKFHTDNGVTDSATAPSTVPPALIKSVAGAGKHWSPPLAPLPKHMHGIGRLKTLFPANFSVFATKPAEPTGTTAIVPAVTVPPALLKSVAGSSNHWGPPLAPLPEHMHGLGRLNKLFPGSFHDVATYPNEDTATTTVPAALIGTVPGARKHWGPPLAPLPKHMHGLGRLKTLYPASVSVFASDPVIAPAPDVILALPTPTTSPTTPKKEELKPYQRGLGALKKLYPASFSEILPVPSVPFA